MADVPCDVLIVGASLGGVAAALRAGAIGATVCLVEPSGWIGGQMTGQCVCTPDENEYVETVGSTAAYRDFRQRVRAFYRTTYQLSAGGAAMPHLGHGLDVIRDAEHHAYIKGLPYIEAEDKAKARRAATLSELLALLCRRVDRL